MVAQLTASIGPFVDGLSENRHDLCHERQHTRTHWAARTLSDMLKTHRREH
jgi:hypothetical protein